MKTIQNISLIVILFNTFIFAQNQTTAPDATNTQNDKYVVQRIILPDGRVLEARITPSPPHPPPGFDRITAVLPSDRIEDTNVLNNVPAFNWSFGCSATSAAMIAGYYDRIAYHYMYSGPTNGGVMPLNNSFWPDWVDSDGDTRHQCPLSATHNGLDGRSTEGHVDDYWEYYGQPGPDPWEGNGTEHTHDNCTGDFMKTNQWINPGQNFNVDGSTVFYNYENGLLLSYTEMENYGIHTEDGGYGIKLFYESRGYTVTEMFNQHILGSAHPPIYGYTYDQYKAEIDAGRPVMIHVEGHTMVGIGYNDDATNLMYIHDTWDYNLHSMTWGGSYSGMKQIGVTIVHLQVPDIIFTNGANSSLNFSQAPPTPPETDWPFAQFSLSSNANGATFNAVTISLSGSYTGAHPFRLQAASSNDFSMAEFIESDASPAGGTVTFSLLNDELPDVERYYWVTVDLSESASGTINGTIADASALDISNATFNAASHYGILNISEDVSLPVELTSFKAFAADNQIILQWKTQSELNNLGFIIERGTVPEGPYSEIASYINHEELRGGGNTARACQYHYNDEYVQNSLTYYYRLTDVSFSGVRKTHGPVSATLSATNQNVRAQGHAALKFSLHQNYPNPFNPKTIIKYELPMTNYVELNIYNLNGQKVATLVSGQQSAGRYQIEWDGSGLAGGIYYYMIVADFGEAGNFQDVKKMILLR